ncbi:MAG: hypothetical protein E6H08_05450 [Bacteroidetes bacterium]|nr:MAG: hypothetical protein E6H08_05450 [Bacteroidota bacterium]
MPSIQVTVHHKLTEHEAMSRIKNLVTQLKHEHGDKVSNIEEEWHARNGKFSFTFHGLGLSATVSLHPGTVEIHGKLPLAVSLFKGKIKEVIRAKANELLDGHKTTDH